MCCHDGAWLESAEVQPLRRLVFLRRDELRALGADLPDRFLEKTPEGAVKTATRAHAWPQSGWPAHFPHTRCVFALPDARCALQALADADGRHPWDYKPRACWMHPLREGARGPLPPPRAHEDDWDRTDDYPGCVSYTRCGAHHEDGLDWREALSAELTHRDSVGRRN
jgi:hypothetical protein